MSVGRSPRTSSFQFPVPNNRFAFYPASLGQQAGWRNFRHISRKIMKTTTTKKSSLGLGKIRQPNTRGKHTRNTKEQTHSRGTVIRVRVVSWCCQAGKAKPCERCMHACIWGRETFLLFLSLVQLCEKNVFCTKFRRGLFCGKTTIGGKTIERIVETWRPWWCNRALPGGGV